MATSSSRNSIIESVLSAESKGGRVRITGVALLDQFELVGGRPLDGDEGENFLPVNLSADPPQDLHPPYQTFV